MVKYVLTSNSSSDSVQAEEIVKELYRCQIIRGFDYEDFSVGILRAPGHFKHPTLLVKTSTENIKIVGLDPIRRYVTRMATKKYLLTWLILVKEISPFLILKISETLFS
jgi:hypothetical protein